MLSRARNERGAVAIIAALMSTTLFMMAAIVIELGIARDVRRQSQNTSDASALAAANVLFPAAGTCAAPNPGTPPCFANAIAAVKTYATNNHGIAASRWSPCSDPEALTHRPESGSGNTCISFDSSTTPTQVRVRLPLTSQSTGLGRLAEVSTISVTASAVASVTKGAGGSYAIFAISDSCGDKTVQLNGNGFRVTGGVHSNDESKMNGNDIRITGNLHSVDKNNLNGGVTVTGTTTTGLPVKPDPLGPLGNLEDIANWRPGGSKAAALGAKYFNRGNAEITDATVATFGPGVYYTTNKVSISGNNKTALNATFVIDKVTEENTVFHVNGNGHRLSYYNDPAINPNKIQVITNAGTLKCDKSIVHLNGNNVDFSGVIYAPRGQVHINGDDATAIKAAVIGLTVHMNGNGPSLSNDGSFLTLENVLALLK